jgi:hypothetical protein
MSEPAVTAELEYQIAASGIEIAALAASSTAMRG